jgi:tetratricopeptide (TPR) repeat protein
VDESNLDITEIVKQCEEMYTFKSYSELLQYLDSQTIAVAPDSEIMMYRGLCYGHMGQTSKAVEILDVFYHRHIPAIQKVDRYLFLAYLYIHCQRYEDAEDILGYIVKMNHQEASLYAMWAYVAQARGQYRYAIRRYRMALDIDADHANALNGLGFLYAELGENLTDALSMCRRALSLRPDDYSCLDSMGWVCYKMGNYTDALRYLQAAYDLAPDTEVIQQHLEMVQRTRGK